MSDSALEEFLRTDPRDVGCARATDILHVYVELARSGVPVEERHPGVAAHLRACGPCTEDLAGLAEALSFGQSPPEQEPPAPTGPGDA
jgi:hypothetical protein